MKTNKAAQEQKEQQRIVIVDDEAAIRNLMAQYFSRLKIDHRIASNGIEALKILEGFPATLLITDLIMPEMDGFELMRKARELNKDMDVIVMTGYSKNFTYTDVIRAGASDFIQKPFPLDELEAKVNRIFRERELRYQLHRLSIKDSLTDLYNRRCFDEKIREEAIRAVRQNYPLFLIMLDLDNFKEINDRKGHQAGDRVLQHVANTIRKSTREHVDICFRFGGDEFAVLIPYATQEQAAAIAERIRTNLLNRKGDRVTASIGLASLQISEPQQLEEGVDDLIRKADSALYMAKELGGNQLVIKDREYQEK